MLHTNLIEECTNHINSLDPNIKFTIEEEQDDRLYFLDTYMYIIVNDDAPSDPRSTISLLTQISI